MSVVKPLARGCVPGDRVSWSTLGGDRFEGRLVEWDSNVAVVLLDDGTTKAVEC